MTEDAFRGIVDEVKAEREAKEMEKDKVAKEENNDVFECSVCHEKFTTLRGKNIHFARTHSDQPKKKKPVVKVIPAPPLDETKNETKAMKVLIPSEIRFDVLVALGFDKAKLERLNVRDFHVIYEETMSGRLTHLEINFYDPKENAIETKGEQPRMVEA